MSWLTADVVDAVCQHMNEDHAAESLAMVLPAEPDAVSAIVEGVDLAGLSIGVTRSDGSTGRVRLEWPTPPQQRADIRTQIVEMYASASGAAPHD